MQQSRLVNGRGAVAQLVERCNRTAEVRGSTPLSSIRLQFCDILSCLGAPGLSILLSVARRCSVGRIVPMTARVANSFEAPAECRGFLNLYRFHNRLGRAWSLYLIPGRSAQQGIHILLQGREDRGIEPVFFLLGLRDEFSHSRPSQVAEKAQSGTLLT